MTFKAKVSYAMQIQKYGYFTVKCMMLKNGATLQDVAQVLVWRLRILGN